MSIDSNKPQSHRGTQLTTHKKKRLNPASFDTQLDSGFVREDQLVQDPKRPEVKAPLPFSSATLWRKVKAGTFPKPKKLSSRVTAWNVGSVRSWLKAL